MIECTIRPLPQLHPLTMSRAGIYELHQKDDKWQRPKNMYYKGWDKSKWRDFHRDYGHIIHNCKYLREGIKDMVQRGYFKQYQGRTDLDGSPREEDGKRKPVKERITKIHLRGASTWEKYTRCQSELEKGKTPGELQQH